MTGKTPSLRPAEMINVLEKAGFRVVRQSGGHVIMFREGMLRPIPVPIHPGSLKRALQNKILKESGISDEELEKLI